MRSVAWTNRCARPGRWIGAAVLLVGSVAPAGETLVEGFENVAQLKPTGKVTVVSGADAVTEGNSALQLSPGASVEVPVRPGVRLRTRGEVLSSTPSASRPDRGRTEILYETVNQRDEVVMSYRATQILKRKR